MSLNFDVRFLKSICALFLMALLITPAQAERANNELAFETNDVIITSEFISSWSVEKVRDHATIHVISTNDFVKAHKIVDELRKIIDEPILVKHSIENDNISYKIIVGRFGNEIEAEKYLNLFR